MSNVDEVLDLPWDELFIEVQKGNVSMDDFLDYMVNLTSESYDEGYHDGRYSDLGGEDYV